jgi:hypothetical protein
MGFHYFDGSNKTIPIARQRLDEPRILGLISQRDAQFIHRSVNAVFKVNEGIDWPELLLDLFPGHHFAGPLEKRSQNLEGAFL